MGGGKHRVYLFLHLGSSLICFSNKVVLRSKGLRQASQRRSWGFTWFWIPVLLLKTFFCSPPSAWGLSKYTFCHLRVIKDLPCCDGFCCWPVLCGMWCILAWDLTRCKPFPWGSRIVGFYSARKWAWVIFRILWVVHGTVFQGTCSSTWTHPGRWKCSQSSQNHSKVFSLEKRCLELILRAVLKDLMKDDVCGATRETRTDRKKDFFFKEERL